MADVLISLGSNVGDPAAQIATAVAHLERDPAIKVKALSALYQTVPVGPVTQDDFVNAAVRIETSLAPDKLMSRLLEIEATMGRDRASAVRWGPRVIDLDVILFDALTLKTDLIEVPHPRFRERAFVLVPMAEIAPDWSIEGQSLRALADAIDQSGVRKT